MCSFPLAPYNLMADGLGARPDHPIKRKPKEHHAIATSAISKGRGGLHR
jgi:hypothetical protein